MSFDRTAYRASKRRAIDLIKGSHDWEKTEGFIADGVICPDTYEQQALRILCVLAESYGYDGCGDETDIETQGIDDVMGVANKTVKTTRTLPTLLWLLIQSLEKRSQVTWEEFPNLLTVTPAHTALLQEALSRVAWINVEKASRCKGTRMDDEEVYQHALRNREVLREQINSTAPHLMIVCGSTVFGALHDTGLLGSSVALGRKWQLQDASNGTRIVEVSHPSPRNPDWRSYESIYDHFETLYRQIVGDNSGMPNA